MATASPATPGPDGGKGDARRQAGKVGHQAQSKQAHGHVLVGVAQEFEEGMEIAILVKDCASAVTAIEDVVTVAADGISQCTHHKRHFAPAQR